MAHFQGMERTAAVWEDLRAELAAFTISISGVREWQEAFKACQELPPECKNVSPLPTVKDDSVISASASTAASATASASGAASAEKPALPDPALQAKKAAATGGAADEATGEVLGKALAVESENTVSAPAALASSLVASASDPAAAAVTEASLGLTAEVPEKKEKEKQEKEKAEEGDKNIVEFSTFVAYVNSLPLDEFNKICSSYDEFLRNECEWMEKRRQRNSESKVCHSRCLTPNYD